jgi:MscS family membrane protein
MQWNKLISTLTDWTGANNWIVQIFIVVFIALCIDLIQRRMLAKLKVKLARTENPWDDALVAALIRPLSLLIWVVGITFAAEIGRNEAGAAIFNAIEPVRSVGVLAAIAWFLVRLTRNVQETIVQRGIQSGKPYDRTTADAIAKLVRVSIFITAALVILQTLGFSISGVLAFGGIGGIAIGFAAKDLLANFFGGLMIYLDRPFSVGDWIRSPDRDIEGTVEDIGWRLTTIRTFSKRPLYIPNSTFANVAVENPSRMSHRRIYETIGLRYDDASKIEVILKDIETMLRQHEEIDATQTLMVNFNAFAASSLDFFIYTFTKTTNWVKFHRVKQDVLIKIEQIIDGHGAEIAFPTSTVHIPDMIKTDMSDATARLS